MHTPSSNRSRVRTLTSLGAGLAVLIALGGTARAQEPHDPKAPEKPATTKPAAGGQEKPSDPAGRTSQPQTTPLPAGDVTTLSVAGLSKANTTPVRTMLEGITHPTWRCTGCNMTGEKAGTCSHCQVDLVSERKASLNNIAIDSDKGTIGFSIAPGQSVRLSEIEAALSPQQIELPETMAIPATSTLVIEGVSSQDQITQLENELKSSQLFSSVTGKLAGGNRQAELSVRGGTTSATRSKLEAALAKAGDEFKLADIVWTAPAAPSAPSTDKPKSKS
jgi:hypothetical protein